MKISCGQFVVSGVREERQVDFTLDGTAGVGGGDAACGQR